MRVAQAILFVMGCVLLYYGTAMLLFVPRASGDLYFSGGRVLYGILPLLASVVVLLVTARLAARSRGLRASWGAVIRMFAYAISAVAVFDIAGMIVGGLLHR